MAPTSLPAQTTSYRFTSNDTPCDTRQCSDASRPNDLNQRASVRMPHFSSTGTRRPPPAFISSPTLGSVPITELLRDTTGTPY